MTQNEYISPKILNCQHYTNVTRPDEKLFHRIVQYYEIDFNLTGERTIWLDGKRFDVTPGSVVCRVPGQRAASAGTYNMYLLTLDFSSSARSPEGPDRPLTAKAEGQAVRSYYWQTLPPLFLPRHRAELLSMYERLSLLWRQKDKQKETDALLASLLHLLLADAFFARLPEEKSKTPVSAAIAYLQKHYAEKITLDSLASAAALNKSYLIRLFKKETGTTPIDYLNSLRLSAAKERLLSSGAPVRVIAEECGYDDPAYFVSRFRAFFGLTPAACRKQAGLDAKENG